MLDEEQVGEGAAEESIDTSEGAGEGAPEQEASTEQPSELEVLREELAQVRAQNREMWEALRRYQEGAESGGEEEASVEIEDILPVPSEEEEAFPGQATLFKGMNEAFKALIKSVDERVKHLEESVRAPEAEMEEAKRVLEYQARSLTVDRNVEVARLAQQLLKGDEKLEQALVGIAERRTDSSIPWTLRELLLEYLSSGGRKSRLAPSARSSSAARSTEKRPPPKTMDEAASAAARYLEAKLGR